MTKPLVHIVCGPTASGKTAYGIDLALKNRGEVVNCDSMQVYKYLDIGTGKPTSDEMQGIPHHLMSVLEPDEFYSVAKYKEDAVNAIQEILARGSTPIVVGGTGQYVSALMDNISYAEMETDGDLRAELQQQAASQGTQAIYDRLVELDPDAAKRLSQADTKRIIRALEIKLTTGRSILDIEAESRRVESPYQFEVHMIDMPREQLYDRINRRVDLMVERGLIEETRMFMSWNLPETCPCAKAIAYKEMAAYIRGEQSLEEAKDYLKQKTRNYAKRQLTWFRNKIRS
ncbi:MAG: tRNA (adenosine(37)-N6)-dimethylallyltransferase MiaA [Clostridia bacterium]|nr:tRNA (adenosine(37)-N6)-dimethylallyltransferase MiaA [Clostridia bacterium]